MFVIVLNGLGSLPVKSCTYDGYGSFCQSLSFEFIGQNGTGMLVLPRPADSSTSPGSSPTRSDSQSASTSPTSIAKLRPRSKSHDENAKRMVGTLLVTFFIPFVFLFTIFIFVFLFVCLFDFVFVFVSYFCFYIDLVMYHHGVLEDVFILPELTWIQELLRHLSVR